MTQAEFGFPRSHRLARKEEFDDVLTNPVLRLRRTTFRVFVRPNAAPRARLGIIIGRRQAPLAVTRNRVKRVIRESFRQRCAQLACIDIVVQVISVPDATATDAVGDVSRRELDSLWNEIEAKGHGKGRSAVD